MVNIKDVRPGNLLVHKKIGVALVIKVDRDLENPELSVIHGCDYDDSIYSGPCEDWYYLWVSAKSVVENNEAPDQKKLKNNNQNEIDR